MNPIQRAATTVTLLIRLSCSLVLILPMLFICYGTTWGEPPADTSPSDPVVAVVNGQQIKYQELYAYMMTGGLSREETLENIIDLYLIREAAANFSIDAPTGTWTKEQRASIEYSLATVMALDIPQTRVTLIVDHAWLKDADTEEETVERRAYIVKLKQAVSSGLTIPQGFARLNYDSSMWHIGDHEEYLYDDIPEEARDLKPDTLSPLINGDGGVHLFWIYQRKEVRPPAETIHSILMARLRDGATIEYVEMPQ